MVFSAGQGRPPRPTVESGAVSYDSDAGCFVGSNGMYWLGTANGGWSLHPKGEKPAKQAKEKPAMEPEDEKPAKRAKSPQGSPKPQAAGQGRPPKRTVESGAVSYDSEAGCFVGSKGLYWLGTTNGGWSRHPRGETPAKQAKDKAVERDEPEAGGKKKPKGRPPACHPQLGTLSFDHDSAVWKTDRGYFWTGSEQLGGLGWTRCWKAPKGQV